MILVIKLLRQKGNIIKKILSDYFVEIYEERSIIV